MISTPTPIRISRLRLPQGQLFWREVGKGPTLVFLHGSFQDGTQWLPLVEKLAPRFHCLMPDLLGCGESDPPEQPQSIQLQAEALRDYLAALRLENYYIVAHSLGAWVASDFALSQPSGLRGMVLLSPEGLLLEAFPHRWQREQQLTATLPITPAALKLASPVAKLVGKHKAIARHRQYRRQLLAAPASCKLLFKRRWSDLQPELLNERLRELRIPTQVLQGGEDDPMVIAHSKAYVKLAPAAQLRYLKDGGHELLTEWLESVTYEIERFVLNNTAVPVLQ